MESKALKKPSKATGATPARRKSSDKAKKPAYLQKKLQKKMQVSDPGDSEEKEADRVAADVKRNISSGNNQIATAARSVGSTGAGIKRAEEEEAQTKLYRQEEEEAIKTKLFRAEEEEAQTKLYRQEEEKAIQTKLFRAEEEEAQTKLYRQEEEEAVQTKLFRAEEEEAQTKLYRQEEEEAVQTKAWRSEADQESEKNGSELDAIEARIAQTRGNGQQLPEKIRKQMEQQFGRDFSGVVIHSDMQADELCKELNARAFAIGNDIYFANGEFNPDSERGQELIAHELTHVVQQGKSVTRKIFRAATPAVDTGANNAATRTAYQAMMTVDIPRPKGQHETTYQSWVNNTRLSRPAGRKVDRKTRQITVWNNSIDVTDQKVRDKLTALGITPPNESDTRAKVALTINGQKKLEKTIPQLRRLLRRPNWDREGSTRKFQVDHKVEYQAASEDPKVDTLENFELFDPYMNQSSGGSLMVSIRRNVQNYLNTIEPYKSRPGSNPKATWNEAGDWLDTHKITFEHVASTGRIDAVEIGSWSVDDIQAIKPLDNAREAPKPEKGTPSTFVLTSPSGGFQLARINHGSNATFQVPSAQRNAIAGIRLGQVSLNGTEGSAANGTVIGTIEANYNLPDAWTPETDLTPLNLVSRGEYMGGVDGVPPLNLDFRGLSPVSFPDLEIGPDGLDAEGQLTPSLNLFNAPLTVTMMGDDLRFNMTYSAGELNLPIPGLSIDDAAASVFYSSRDGFGASGMVFFSVPKLGGGQLELSASQRAGFGAEGKFNFDSNLFDTAEIDVWYREGAFGGRGTLEITQPGKIKGIRAARLTASFEENAFSAEGTVDPNIPGVQQAGLTVDYSEEEGLTIGGSLQLSANPAIRSGSIEVKVNKQGEEWKVSGEGTAQPAIPGIDSELTVGYEDGGFKAEFSGAFQRGMLSGRVMVGVSNRAVGEDGQPSGDPLPGGELLVYGSGSATIQIAPWLQGTAGVRFDPDGEVTVSGEIGIPDELEIFARKEINKSIFSIAVQAPIIPGIVAEVGGGLSATAGIGPGVIDELRIGIEYNPAREEDTKVTGDAHLKVPADAGLRLSVRAGIGLGITGASATGGLDIGGTLGISGAAEAGVHIDWTPATGLDLTANLSIYAQPSFTFDIGGYVSVRVFGFSVYDDRFQFASYTFGSDYRFGIKMPVHYHEGEPFDISTDDIEFEVPDINTNDLLKGLISRIT